MGTIAVKLMYGCIGYPVTRVSDVEYSMSKKSYAISIVYSLYPNGQACLDTPYPEQAYLYTVSVQFCSVSVLFLFN